MNGADGERKNKRDVGEGVGGKAEEEVASSQRRGQWGKSCKIAGATFPEQSQLQQCSRIFPAVCLSICFPVCLSRLLSSFASGLAAASCAAAAAATAAMWLSLQ